MGGEGGNRLVPLTSEEVNWIHWAGHIYLPLYFQPNSPTKRTPIFHLLKPPATVVGCSCSSHIGVLARPVCSVYQLATKHASVIWCCFRSSGPSACAEGRELQPPRGSHRCQRHRRALNAHGRNPSKKTRRRMGSAPRSSFCCCSVRCWE